MTTDDTRLKRLRFRAWHRGFLEADLILGPFADKHAQDLTPAELDELERLLEQPDQDLYEWIVERRPTPPEFDGVMMARLKKFRFDAYEARAEEAGEGRDG